MSKAEDAAATDRLRDTIIKTALSAKRTQKKLSGACFKYMMDCLFAPELDKPLNLRTRFKGTILGMDFGSRRGKRSTVYVQIFDPWIEVKLRVDDLNEYYNCTYDPTKSFSRWGTTVRAVPRRDRSKKTDSTTAPDLVLGAYLTVRVAGYVGFPSSDRSDRWKFDVTGISRSIPNTKSWKSTMKAYRRRGE